ncbi:MAG: MFS transporter [Gammaproteobacteria bacterium]|nr:MFS transporter [Gammaproteobacteria bacterium]
MTKTNLSSTFPQGLGIVLYTEICELFGRFAIISLLVLYLTKMFHCSDAKAFTIYSAFIALIYVTPIVGGFLTDKFLGLRHSIILGGILMSAGNTLMAISHFNFVYLGLATVAVGNGFFTPALIAMVGRLYQDKKATRDTGFTIYYITKNIGALLAPTSCAIVGKYFGFNYAFALSAIVMASGVLIFCLGQKRLRNISPRHPVKAGKRIGLTYVFTILLIPVISIVITQDIEGYLLAAAGIGVLLFLAKLMPKLDQTARRHILYILIMMLFVMIFSAFLNQGGTTLNLFIDRIVTRNIHGITIPTASFYTLDPLFMLLAGPVLAAIFAIYARRKRPIAACSKFSLGMLIFSLGFAVFSLASFNATRSGHASMLYVVIAYALFPIAELCIMPTALSLLTELAPAKLEAMMVGIFMLASAEASYLTGIISKIGKINFDLSQLSGLQHAASIYLHLFIVSTVALIITSMLIMMLKPLLQKSGRP